MKKAYIIIAAAAMLVAGCQKERTFNGMELVAEGFGGGAKAAVSGNASYWVEGEAVRINNETKTVQIEGNTAYVTDVAEAAQYRALYPASLNSSYDGSSSSVTVTIPASYQWAVDGSGRQVLDVPMAAYGTGGDRLVFKHITAAITVEITNYYGFPVLVDNVSVSSSDAGTQYQLCGSKEISLTSSDISVAANASNSNNTVQVNFNDHSLRIDQGATARVQVPVLPVGSGNKFSIDVTVHKEGNAAVTKTYTKTQATGGAMGRAKMGYAGDTVGFTFSVSASKKVIISQGNLQYQASTNTWRFAEHQYDYVGDASNGNVYVNEVKCNNANVSSSYSGWIDLFGWGTSGYNHGATCYLPYSTSTNRSHYNPYGNTSYNLYDQTGQADWGYNAILNGGNTENSGWHTLSDNECLYVLSSRANRCGRGNVSGVNGLVVLPDEWTLPSGVNFTPGSSNWANVYNTDQWALMEANGAVFLPAAGYRENGQIGVCNEYLMYWTSTHYGSNAYYTRISGTEFRPTYDNGGRECGLSVRLVRNVN